MERLFINYILRSQKSPGLRQVQCRMTIRGERIVYPTGLKVLPKDWSNKKLDKDNFRQVKSSMIGYRNANQQLHDLHHTAQSLFRRFIQENNRTPSKDEFREQLDIGLGKAEKSKPLTFFQFYEKFIERRKNQMTSEGKRTSGNTVLTVYRQTLNLLREFETETREKISFESISLELRERLVTYMQDEKDFRPGNIGKHIKTLKTVLNDALEQGLTNNRAHQSKRFTTITAETFAIALTWEEVEAIASLDLSNNKGHDEQRDLFVLMCSTGLRFSDASKLNKKSIVNSEGRKYIQTVVQKTQQDITIPVDARLEFILKKYEETEKGFPNAYANPVFNRYIKQIGKQVEQLHDAMTINFVKGGKHQTEMKMKYELLTAHSGRRTFATHYYNHTSVPTKAIMRITGHKTESSFLKYIRTTPLDDAKMFVLALDQQNMRIA